MSKFKFNKDLLDIVEDKLGIGGWILRGIKYFIISALLALLYYLIYALIFNTKEEELLSKQNRLYHQELKRVEEKMDNLDKVISQLKDRDVEIYKGIFKASPPMLSAGGYSQNLFEQIDSSNDAAIIKVTSSKISTIERIAKSGSVLLSQIENESRKRGGDELSLIPSVLPVEFIGSSQTGASVGKKIHPFYKTATEHKGLDLLSSIGAAVYATADGVVVEASKSDKGQGNRVVISHGSNYRTLYAHLSEILVRPGQSVKRGSVIARVGNSGLSFAPHLHYEVIYKGRNMEPINYFFAQLSPSQVREMLVVAVNSGQSLD